MPIGSPRRADERLSAYGFWSNPRSGQSGGQRVPCLSSKRRHRSRRTGDRLRRMRKRVYLPMRSRLRTSTSRTTPAAILRWNAGKRTFLLPATLLERRRGQPRPRQRTVIREHTAARTVSSRTRTPVSIKLPASRTTGGGLSSGGRKGLSRTYSGRPGATSRVRERTAVALSLSVTRSPTTCEPAGKVRVADGPEASSKRPSPSRSQACSVKRPPGSHA
jgi:hypothetical protein